MASNIDHVSKRRKIDPQPSDSEPDHEVDRLIKLMGLVKLDPSKLLPEMKSLDVPKLKQIYEKADAISVLITGKTGSGKSTLTNGILGLNIRQAQESSGIKPCTTEITKYHAKKGTIDVTVWDSPGLQDGTGNQEEYIKQLKEKCKNRDLTLYCIRISDIRFVSGDDNPDVVAMKKLTKTFGNEFWGNTIIVLTFANTLEAFNPQWEDLTNEEKVKAFQAKKKEWENGITEILIKDIQVPQEIVKDIPIFPAGFCAKPHLPGCKYWLSALWFKCLFTIPTPEKKAALLKMTADRLKAEEDARKEDFRKKAEQQRIYYSSSSDSGWSCSVL